MHVQQHGMGDISQQVQHLHQRVDIVAVHRAEVAEAKGFEHLLTVNGRPQAAANVAECV